MQIHTWIGSLEFPTDVLLEFLHVKELGRLFWFQGAIGKLKEDAKSFDLNNLRFRWDV